jgi:hypothetical protein
MIELRIAIQEQVPARVVTSLLELERILQEAALQAKSVGRLNIIFLYGPSGDHLSLVVGGDETVLGFNYGHGDPPYYASDGADEGAEPVLTAYVGVEHHTEFPRRWVVPMKMGIRAAAEFLATGERPTGIKWVEL